MDSSIYTVEERDPGWPILLKELPERVRPKKLYIKGTLPPPDALIVAIVGTRRPSYYGKEAAYSIARKLAEHRIVIVSGMARGIDSIAHKAALDAGTPTIAVLGTGLDERVIYPRENMEVAKKIIGEGGAVISEYEPDTHAEHWTFPQRNRIIAGISRTTIVIEAGAKSGALITARFATEFGRDVFALPGSIYSSQSQGTNNLIKQGAIPITSELDILEALGLKEEATPANAANVSSEEQKILSALEEELALDEIIKKTGLPAGEVLALITTLEIRGMIKGIGGGIYRKV